MSQYSRSERNASAGIVVGITPADYPEGPLAGIAFQRRLEEKAFALGGTLRGFAMHDAVLTGIETGTSSPIRVPRHGDSLQSVNTPGLFPAGEGAGFAGGILSSAIDGIRVAEAVARDLLG